MSNFLKAWEDLLDSDAQPLRLQYLNDNQDFDWEEFNPYRYVEEQYAPMLSADVDMVKDLIGFYSNLPENVEIGDFGTGPSLLSLMVAATKAKSITIHEYSPQNIAYLIDVINDPQHADWRIWQKWWDKICEIDPNYSKINIHEFLMTKVDFFNDPYSLLDGNEPTKKYDVVSSFFVAESITGNKREHRIAVKKLTSHTKENGYLVSAFLIGAKGYNAGGGFPAVAVTPQSIQFLIENLGFVTKQLNRYKAEGLQSVQGSNLGLIIGRKC